MADKFFDAMFTASVIGGSSGPAPVIVAKNIAANGTYSALDDQADGFNPVVVDVPNTYTAGDEGKVVSDGELVAQTSTTATTNGTLDTTNNNQVVVNVPNTYTAADEGKVVSSGELVAQTSTTATANGTIDTTTNNQVVVNVPNSYTSGDEGKVVSDGALVAQTARTTITTNGTYDTTLNNSVTVNVPTGTTIYNITSLTSGITDVDLHFYAKNNKLYIYGSFNSGTVTSTKFNASFGRTLSSIGISGSATAPVLAAYTNSSVTAFNATGRTATLSSSSTTCELPISTAYAVNYIIGIFTFS